MFSPDFFSLPEVIIMTYGRLLVVTCLFRYTVRCLYVLWDVSKISISVESMQISKYLQWSQVNPRVEQSLNLYVVDKTTELQGWIKTVRSWDTVKMKQCLRKKKKKKIYKNPKQSTYISLSVIYTCTFLSLWGLGTYLVPLWFWENCDFQ